LVIFCAFRPGAVFAGWVTHTAKFALWPSMKEQKKDRCIALLFLLPPDQPWGPHSLLFSGYLLSFPGIEWPGSEVYHSPPSKTEVKNE
jgi:hypothetical protein